MNIRTLQLIIFCSLLTGCTSKYVLRQEPFIITGILHSSAYTGWQNDLCEDNTDCLQIGGEIYSVKVRDPKSLNGSWIPNNISIGVIGHILIFMPESNQKYFIVLEPVEDAIKLDTGIQYMAVEFEPVQELTCLSKPIENYVSLNQQLLKPANTAENKNCYYFSAFGRKEP
jgi:hypothetical protein